MQLVRLAASPELNNAWIIGIATVSALAATWLAVGLSSFLIRTASQSLRIAALQTFTEGYARRARLVAVLASIVIVLAGSAVVVYALWQQRDLQPLVDEALGQITEDTWLAIARSAGLMVVFLLAFILLRIASRRLIARVRARLEPREMPERQRRFLERFFGHLPSVINLALANALLGLAAEAFAVPAQLAWLLLTSVYILLAITGGRALVMLAHLVSERLLDKWEHRSKGTRLEESYAALRRLLPVGQRSIEAIVYVSAATLIVRRFEALEAFAPYGPLLIRVISMFLAASVVVEIIRALVGKLLLAAPSAAEDTQRRRVTFVGLIQSILTYIVYFCVSMIVLGDLGIDPTPILAGAGIVGLTVGLGAQKIVADLLNGLFLLFEDQILQGDWVKIRDTEGQVEQLSLRITRIRDRYGRLHILRNGEIQNVINYSRGWTLVVVDVGVAYEDDLVKALRVIGEASARLPQELPDDVFGVPVVKGIEEIGASALIVRVEAKVAPGAHRHVKRALNRLLVDGFRVNDLEIPYPKAVRIEVQTEAAAD